MSTLLSPKAAEIVTVTRTLLARGGYHSFSYADIATQVGISKPSIHHHFPSKAQLVQVVVAQYRAEALAGMAAMDQDVSEPAAVLRAFVEFWTACLVDDLMPFCICAMLASEQATLPDEVASEVRGHFDDLSSWLAQVLQRGQSSGQLQLADSAATEAKLLMASVHGAMLAARALGDVQVFGAIAQLAIQRLMHSSPKASPTPSTSKPRA